MNHYDLSRYQCMKQLFDQPVEIEAMEEKSRKGRCAEIKAVKRSHGSRQGARQMF
jgi:hypothetical protein